MAHLIHPDEGSQISKQFPLEVDDVSVSSSITAISSETVALYYSNSGARTSDAGQAAGTAVQGNLAYKNILDSSGSRAATFNDKSLSFTGDCFTTEVKFPVDKAESAKNYTWANKLAAITAGFSNGQYCVDYRTGEIWGKKATTTASLTSTAYKINTAQVSGSVTLSTGDVEIGAVEIKNATDDTRATVGANGLYTEVRASALPTGAATEAGNLATIAGDTTSIDGKTPALGNGAMAASVPVTIASDDTLTTAVKNNTTDIPNVIGTDGAAGPTKALSVAGTDGSGNLQELSVNTAGEVYLASLTTIGHGVTTVTTAGTDVALAGSTACKKVIIQAQTDNTGLIAVGATGVDATEATGTGVLLAAGEAVEIEITNLATVYIDSTVNGEGVRYTYLT